MGAQEDLSDGPLDRVSDFAILGGGSSLSAATELHVALRRAGFESFHLMSDTAQWLSGGGSGSPSMGHMLERCRVCIFFYSEKDALAAQIYRDQTFLRGHLIPTMLHANEFAPTLVVLTDGSWPLPESPIQIVRYPAEGTSVLIGTLFRIWGVAFFARKLEEAQQESLARLFRNGLIEAMGGRQLRVFVFGPGKPEQTIAGMISFEGRLWQAREGIRREIDACGVASVYGEDLEAMAASKLELAMNPSLKERIFASQVDLIVFLAGSVGSAAELGVFSQYPDLCRKTHVWVCDEHKDGFLAKGPAQECVNFGAAFKTYARNDLDSRSLEFMVLEGVRRQLEALAANRFSSSPRRQN